jgi:hypothetical protein
MREWAEANGFAVSDRGRLPAEIVKAYEEREEIVEVEEAPAKPARKRAPRKKANA